MNIDIHCRVSVPIRDGVALSATIYMPNALAAPAPCVLTMSPYLGDTYHDLGIKFASHGLPFVVVDVRGRGNSEGVFHPRIQEAHDAHDVVLWLAQQNYCDGQVGMRGASYCGYAQWAAAKTFPPHLVTMVPTAAPCPGLDVPFRSNIFAPYLLQWLTLIDGKCAQFAAFADRAFWARKFHEWYRSGRSFRDLDITVGTRSDQFRCWLDHPEPDDFWDAHNPTDEQYAEIEIPILTITGQYDGNQLGALEHYRRHIRNASPAARQRHYLVIGPWDHAGASTPKTHFGGITTSPAAVIDLPQLHMDWYEWTMRHGDKPSFLQKPVAYFCIGDDVWKYVGALEDATVCHQPLYLDSKGPANDVFCSGCLSSDPGIGQPDSYTYDPRDTDNPAILATASAEAASLIDQTVVLASSGRHVVYHSGPFGKETELSGFLRLQAWISIDCPDTDIYASVYEIANDGRSVLLGTDAIRARYREGLRKQRLISTDAPLEYNFDRFHFISRVVKQGHRLRLVISPFGALLPEPFTQKNYNAGGVVAEESAADARTALVRVFHDADHPSALFIPLGRAEFTQDGVTLDSND